MQDNPPIFRRKIYDQMLQWKRVKDGSTALMIKGARRVGKSTIAEEFARNEYESYIVVNFDNAPQSVWEAVDNIADLNDFFFRLQFIYHVDLKERKSVIIFDEIQKAPMVRQAIKYLVKDHRYDYIETGSLLSIRRNVQNITIPSEETRLTMFPMDYEEFRWAMGDFVTFRQISETLVRRRPLGEKLNRKLMRDFRLYLLVGGMPQSVNAYLQSNNLSHVDQVKREILQLYDDDFHKIDGSGRIARLFRSIPSRLSRHTSRFVPDDSTSRSVNREVYERMLSELEESLCVNFVYHANNPSVGLAMNMDSDRFKLYLADTGLFVTLAFWDKGITENIIYRQLLSDKLSANLGYVYENVVAQMLRTAGYELFYYTWPTPSGKHNYEIDFILSKGKKICPIEVKSSGYKTHVSLDRFCEKFSSVVAEPYLIYTKDLCLDRQTIMLPAYLTPVMANLNHGGGQEEY